MTPHRQSPTDPRSTRATLLLLATAGALFLALPSGFAAGDDAVITVVFTADDAGFTATSTKDLSNIIVELCDGTTHKHDGLSGKVFVHNETQDIVGVWVKSGNNGIPGNNPPGAGARFDNAGVSCSSSSSTTTTTSQSETTTTSQSETTTTSASETTTTSASETTTTSASETTTTSASETTTTSQSETETTQVPFFGGGTTFVALGSLGALGGALFMLRRRL